MTINPSSASSTTAGKAAKSASAQTERAANDAVNIAQKAAETLSQTAENIGANAAQVLEAGAKTINDMYGEFNKIAREQSEKVSKTMADTYQDANSAFKANMNCFAQATNIYARSCETISREMFSFCQNMFESNVAAMRNIMSCRNAQEALDIQTNLAKNNIENTISECTRISQLAFEAANKSFQPIQEQINTNVDRFAKAA
jgi:hypothetical protein